jgi:uncharacterized protein (DUF433 family)
LGGEPDTAAVLRVFLKVMGGKACIRGMRVTVSLIISQIAADYSVDTILNEYPYLEKEDITQALRYAAILTQGH